MPTIEAALKIQNYKNFESAVGYEALKGINIVIGRNNVGKSSLLDLIDYACKPKPLPAPSWRNGKEPDVILTRAVQEHDVRRVFPPNTSGGEIGGNHGAFGAHLVGNEITVRIPSKGDSSLLAFEPYLSFWRTDWQTQKGKLQPYWNRLADTITVSRKVLSTPRGRTRRNC